MARKPKRIEYLSAEEVSSLRASVLGAPLENASHYVLSHDRLASALDRPAKAAFYEQADLVRQAATLLWGLINAHAFIDGNKRVAWVATRDFLAINGYALTATGRDIADVVTGIAEHDYDVDATEAWLRSRVWRRSRRKSPTSAEDKCQAR